MAQIKLRKLSAQFLANDIFVDQRQAVFGDRNTSDRFSSRLVKASIDQLPQNPEDRGERPLDTH